LREARETAGLTKAEVSTRTKITMEQLNHLEDGLPPKLANVYARSFLRTYSELVKLDNSAEIYAAYKQLITLRETEADNPLTSKYMNNTYLDENPTNIRAIALGIVIALVLALAALYFSPSLREKVFSIFPGSVRESPAQEVTDQQSSEVLPANDQSPAEPAKAPETYSGRLTLRAEKPTFAQVSVDNAPIVHVVFEPGKSQSFEGENSVNVIAGDGQALRMEWNGQDRGYLGREGPVDINFPITSPDI
jgi:cytoskeletal protein RodZ